MTVIATTLLLSVKFCISKAIVVVSDLCGFILLRTSALLNFRQNQFEFQLKLIYKHSTTRNKKGKHFNGRRAFAVKYRTEFKVPEFLFESFKENSTSIRYLVNVSQVVKLKVA